MTATSKSKLIVSDPPHLESAAESVDFQAVAPLFGLAVAEIRQRAAFPAPEPWFVVDEQSEIDSKLETLRGAGFSIQLHSLAQFVALPSVVVVREMHFEDNSLSLIGEGVSEKLSYEAPIAVVFAKPLFFDDASAKRRKELEKGGKRKGLESRQDNMRDMLGGFGVIGAVAGEMASQSIDDPSLSATLDDPVMIIAAMKEEFKHAFVDLITLRGKEFIRFRAAFSDFKMSCLGNLATGNLKQDIEQIISNFEKRFMHSIVDRRLVGASCRDPLLQSQRFSLILAELEPSLAEITPVEIASRSAALVGLRRLVDSGKKGNATLFM